MIYAHYPEAMDFSWFTFFTIPGNESRAGIKPLRVLVVDDNEEFC